MKIVQIVPREKLRLCPALVIKEAATRKKDLGTFYRGDDEKRNSTKWLHKAYRGWINLERGLSEVVLAEIHAAAEWQLSSAFLGFIDRHFDDEILAITIRFR